MNVLPHFELETTVRRVAGGLLFLYSMVTVVSLAGYGIFGRHPELLQRVPHAPAVYALSFSLFARIHIGIGALALCAYLGARVGAQWVPAFALTYVVALTSELVGTSYGLPFGAYSYGPLLGAKWFGEVPWLIPLSWFLMALPAYALATHRFSERRYLRIGFSTLILVVWDLSLDPAMSDLTNYWTWNQPGVYRGMPLINLAGWTLTGGVLMTLLEVLEVNHWTRRLSVRWCASYYGITVLLPLGMLIAAGAWGAVGISLGGLGIIAGIYDPSLLNMSGPPRIDGDNPQRPASAANPSVAPPSAENGSVQEFFEVHSRSFSYAARWFSERQRHLIACLYAFCRFTDDIVDQRESSQSVTAVEQKLDQWRLRAKTAYEGHESGYEWLDDIMTASAEAGLPFERVDDLIAGVRTDLGSVTLQSTDEFDQYAYRVASVVGIWLCHLFDVHDPEVHERAATMGRAMQTTNILRDVGEDLKADRIYLPADLRARHGVSRRDLEAMATGREITSSYKSLLQELIKKAEADYEYAWPGLRLLPRPFARSAAVAATVYKGIHDSLRKNNYDNFRHRAHTSPLQKGMLAAQGLYRLRRGRPSVPFVST